MLRAFSKDSVRHGLKASLKIVFGSLGLNLFKKKKQKTI